MPISQFETLDVADASIGEGWTMDVRLVREASEPRAHFLVYAADIHGPFATVDEALACGAQNFAEISWRGSLELRGDDVRCPICNAPLERSSRYPRALCPVCVLEAVDPMGRGVRFVNTGMGGGFQARRVDGGSSEEHACFVRGVRCWADEAHLGGIVVQTVEDESV